MGPKDCYRANVIPSLSAEKDDPQNCPIPAW